MFLGSREEALRVLRIMGYRVCVYMGEGWPHFCDCKYGGPSDRPGTEQTGCPELASLYAVVSAMTDAQWREMGMLAGGVLVSDVTLALVGDEGGE